MKKRGILVALFLVLVCVMLDAQSPSASQVPASLLSFTVTPNFSIPLGADTALYRFGGGANLSGEYRLPFLPLLFLGGNLGYSFVPLQAVTSLSLLEAGLEAGILIDFLPSLSLRAFGSGGYSYGLLNDAGGNGGTPFVAAGTGVSWAFVPSLSLGVGASYRYFFDLYNDIAITLGLSYNLPVAGAQAAQPAKQQIQPPVKPAPLESKGLVIKELSLGEIFPILHAYYDTNPVGTIVLQNTESTSVTEVKVSFSVKQYMDAPKESLTVAELKPGEEKSLPLFALFKNTVFEIKQSTKVPAEILLSYSLKGKPVTVSKVETLRILDRNALSWDDTCKAAAFVMPKEPAVLLLSNQINSFVSDAMNKAIDKSLQTAMAIHDALHLFGIKYVSPPLTSYANRSQNKLAVDSVKFPLETIEYRSGDCSDLSVLYCSLLESVQIETAFVTIPGHIFMAFALGSSEEEVRKTFTHTDEFIFREGKVWVPVEVTERDGPFLAAWYGGAKEWRENLLKKQADFYPVRSAWIKYEPVNFPGIGSQPPLPDQAKVLKDFQDDLLALISREISDREANFLAAVERSHGSAQSLNALGVLYARYDLESKAEAQFQAALKNGEDLAALLNLGNLRFLRHNMDGALEFYERAAGQAPHNPSVLLALARANHELQNYGTVSKQYKELRTLSPELANRFSYLQLQGEEATRAAQTSQLIDTVVWEEEK